MRRVAFFGRFQPFHLGHLYASLWLLERFDEIVFIIGMSSESYTITNPFTPGERIVMIRRALTEHNVDLSRVITVTLPTLPIGVQSVSTVLAYIPKVDALASANPIIIRLFSDYGVKVITPPLVRRDVYRGSYIRQLMIKNDPTWRKLVPKSVAEYIDEIKGVERLVMISKSY